MLVQYDFWGEMPSVVQVFAWRMERQENSLIDCSFFQGIINLRCKRDEYCRDCYSGEHECAV